MTNASIITKILGIKYPIISAPMANASGGWLAAEVTNAGGLGLIGAGYCDDEWVNIQVIGWQTPDQVAALITRVAAFPVGSDVLDAGETRTDIPVNKG